MRNHRKPRRFRYHRNNNRGHSMRGNGSEQAILGTNLFQNLRPRNNFKQQQSAEKLLEKYSALAKEALSSGDRILSESYLQHADHYMRIVQEKNINQNKLQPNTETKSFADQLNENSKIQKKV